MKVGRMAGAAVLGVMCFGFIGLAGCDGGGSATPARSHGGLAAVEEDGRARSEWGERRNSENGVARAQDANVTQSSAREETPLFEGRPIWSDNRRHTAQENLQYQFEHHGEELGAKTLEAFVTKTHAFVSAPPPSTMSITRANGDKLMFDPKSGLFAVARRDGAPRTVFKPDDGAAYWRAQEAGVQRDREKPRTARSSDGGRGESDS